MYAIFDFQFSSDADTLISNTIRRNTIEEVDKITDLGLFLILNEISGISLILSQRKRRTFVKRMTKDFTNPSTNNILHQPILDLRRNRHWGSYYVNHALIKIKASNLSCSPRFNAKRLHKLTAKLLNVGGVRTRMIVGPRSQIDSAETNLGRYRQEEGETAEHVLCWCENLAEWDSQSWKRKTKAWRIHTGVLNEALGSDKKP